MELPRDAQLPCDEFKFCFNVRFDDFDNDYPMCVTTETNALQCHGLGPVYGHNRGRMTVYLYTKSGKGPHGRGINGDDGCVISAPLRVGVRHNVCVIKTRRTLSIAIDGNVVEHTIPSSMADADFDMKSPGRTLVAQNTEPYHILHGKLQDFELYSVLPPLLLDNRLPRDAQLPCDEFKFCFNVRFDDFDNDYPMCVTTETNALQCHGLGPVYGHNRGRMTVYLYTKSGKGPHGRGINGDDGCVISAPLRVGVRHNVCVIKTRRTLSIAIDGNVVEHTIPSSMADADFDMKSPGRTLVAQNTEPYHILHGKLQDFELYSVLPPLRALY